MNKTDLEQIDNLHRIENFSRDNMNSLCMDLTHAVYPHHKIYGKYCTLEEYINCPPEEVFKYLAVTKNLEEWTYSLREMQSTEDPQVYKFLDKIGNNTDCYCKTVANESALTVDYHCAWDQGKHLWMIYLMRIIPAQLVFNKPGSVVIWTNCHHPFYENNPYPETAPKDRKVWVGDVWDMFYAGHYVEMQNLKKILEHRFYSSSSS